MGLVRSDLALRAQVLGMLRPARFQKAFAGIAMKDLSQRRGTMVVQHITNGLA